MPRKKAGALGGVSAGGTRDTARASSPTPRPVMGGRKGPLATGRPPSRMSERLSRARVVPSSALESVSSAPTATVSKAATEGPVLETGSTAAVEPTAEPSPTAVPAVVAPAAARAAVAPTAARSPTAVSVAGVPAAAWSPTAASMAVVPAAAPSSAGVPLAVVPAAAPSPTAVPVALASTAVPATTAAPAAVAPTEARSPTAVPVAVVPAAARSPTAAPTAVEPTDAPPPAAVSVAVAPAAEHAAGAAAAVPAAVALKAASSPLAEPFAEAPTAVPVSVALTAARSPTAVPVAVAQMAAPLPTAEPGAVAPTVVRSQPAEQAAVVPTVVRSSPAVAVAVAPTAASSPTTVAVAVAPTAAPLPTAETAAVVPAAVLPAAGAVQAAVAPTAASSPSAVPAAVVPAAAPLPTAEPVVTAVVSSTVPGGPRLRFAVAPPPRRTAGHCTPGSTGQGTTAPHATSSSATVAGSNHDPSPIAAVRQPETLGSVSDGEGSEITSQLVETSTSQGVPQAGAPHNIAGGGAGGVHVGSEQGVAGPASRTKNGKPPGLPEDGVYSLSATAQAQMGTLLRVLFQVRTSSDQSIMPFLAIAHYMMAFSYLAGVSAGVARTRFFDALRVAFENPVSMKRFMETSFGCGHQGLHVGGRMKLDNHVAGQPDGLRKDELNHHLNPKKLKGQWLCRRLLLRTHVDVQVGAHSPAGGLTASDRETVAASLADGSTCSLLRELGCTVKFSKGGTSGKSPLSLAFRWDASSTWFAGGIEADLVGVLRKTLLKVTPVIHSDRDIVKNRLPKAAPRPGTRKRSADPNTSDGPSRTTKRPKDIQIPSLDDLAPGCCSRCGRMASDDGSTSTQATPSTTPAEEYWSADVAKSATLPHGGHVLSCSLPMHMDAGPNGRSHVHVDVNKTSAVGAPAFTYSFFVSASTLPPAPVDAVPGATFSSPPASAHASASHSLDLLRSVKTFLAKREQSRPSAPDVRSARVPSDVQLIVRHAQTPVPLVVRFNFVSAYELSLRAELVERVPGRVTVFLVGLQPPPVGGSVVL